MIKNRGFTLIELLIVVGIMTVITAVTMANYGEFGAKILLRNMTYDLALTVREAQVFGASGRFQDVDTFGNTTPIIMYFDNTVNAPYLFYTFKDSNGNYEQDAGEFVSGYNLGRGFTISDITANTGTIPSIDRLAIRFKRPESDAIIQNRETSSRNGDIYADTRITVMSPKGEELSVVVESAGQISVQRVAP